MRLSHLNIPNLPLQGKLFSIWLNEYYYELADDGDTLVLAIPSREQTEEFQRISEAALRGTESKLDEMIRHL
jgi:hypothetical protein